MSHDGDDWDVPDEGDESPVTRKPAPVESAPADADQMRRIARREIVKAWQDVGVDFSTFAKRQDHAALYVWIRERKKTREQGSNKAWTALIGAVVSAAVAGLATFLTGFKH